METLATTVPNAAAALGIGKSKLYELVGEGRIETIKIGRRSLVLTASLRDFVEQCR